MFTMKGKSGKARLSGGCLWYCLWCILFLEGNNVPDT